MATDATTDISTLLVATPGVNGGRLCLAGTGLSVLQVAVEYKRGCTAEEIWHNHYGDDEKAPIPLSDFYAAIAYYLANRERMDAELQEELKAYDRAAAEHRAASA
jgi:uncharacterized protein (DUF433 family)